MITHIDSTIVDSPIYPIPNNRIAIKNTIKNGKLIGGLLVLAIGITGLISDYTIAWLLIGYGIVYLLTEGIGHAKRRGLPLDLLAVGGDVPL